MHLTNVSELFVWWFPHKTISEILPLHSGIIVVLKVMRISVF